MMKNISAVLGACVVAALVILIVTLPVSGMRGTGPQDGTGNQFGDQEYQNGTGQGYQQTGVGNMSCPNASCPNNGTPLRDGTGQKYGHFGENYQNGSQCQNRSPGCINQSGI